MTDQINIKINNKMQSKQQVLAHSKILPAQMMGLKNWSACT